MEPLDQTEDVEKQSAVIKGETLGEKKEENVEIKTEVKEEYVEPASLSQVKLDPLAIKTEEVKEENVDGIIVCSLIQNEIKREIKTEDLKEEYIEVPDFQQPLRTEGDQIILEPEEAVLRTGSMGHLSKSPTTILKMSLNFGKIGLKKDVRRCRFAS